MSPDAKWVIGIGLLIILPLIAVVWMFLRKEIASAHATAYSLETGFEQWKRDKEKFDHDFRHDEYAPAITRINSELWPLIKQVEVLESEQKKAEEWKHKVVDPIIPRAVEEHERRLNRVEAKIFNGHK